jgi:hypothetical protein
MPFERYEASAESPFDALEEAVDLLQQQKIENEPGNPSVTIILKSLPDSKTDAKVSATIFIGATDEEISENLNSTKHEKKSSFVRTNK